MQFPVSKTSRPMAIKPLLLVSVLASCFANSAMAQEAGNPEEKTLQPVVVTASRVEQLQKDAIPDTIVITSEVIRNKKLASLPSLLRSEAGIDLVQSGGAGTAMSMYVRGTESNQVLVMIDGVPIYDVSSTGATAALEHIQPDQIDHIEVVRGNVSAIYGSGAMGGVIQIFTKQGSGKPSGNVFAEYGSHGTVKFGAGISGQSDGTRFALSATRYKTNGFSANDPSVYPNENPDRDRDRNVSLNAALSQKLNKDHELGARIYLYDAKYAYDGGGSGNVDQIDKGTSKQWTGAIFSKNRITSDWLSTVTLSQSDVKRKYITENSYGFDGVSDYKSVTSMAQWENRIALSSQWTATAGVDAAREKAEIVSSYSNLDSSRSKYSAYAGALGNVGSHHLQANVRYDNVEKSGSDVTGYLGYGFDLTSSWKLLASASTAFLAPTLYQQYDLTYGNTSLKAERSNSQEVGIQYAQGINLVRATVFNWRSRDMITTGSNGRYTNLKEAKNIGFELNAKSQIAGVDLRGTLTIQDPKNRETGERLDYRAKTLGSIDVSKTIGQWYLGSNIQYTGKRKGYDFSSWPSKRVDLSSYWLVNLDARYNLNKNVSLYARIENLFDKDYETVYGFEQPSRGAYVGVNFKM